MILHAVVEDGAPERAIGVDAELVELLAEASAVARSAGRLNIVFLYAPNRDHLTLVVGGEETVLGFNYGHGDPPYFASVGPADVDLPVVTAFVGLKHHTEFLRRWVIPYSAGREAAREFLATGRRPEAIEWAEV